MLEELRREMELMGSDRASDAALCKKIEVEIRRKFHYHDIFQDVDKNQLNIAFLVVFLRRYDVLYSTEIEPRMRDEIANYDMYDARTVEDLSFEGLNLRNLSSSKWELFFGDEKIVAHLYFNEWKLASVGYTI